MLITIWYRICSTQVDDGLAAGAFKGHVSLQLVSHLPTAEGTDRESQDPD